MVVRFYLLLFGLILLTGCVPLTAADYNNLYNGWALEDIRVSQARQAHAAEQANSAAWRQSILDSGNAQGQSVLSGLYQQ